MAFISSTTVCVVPYDPCWPALFDAEKRRILSLLSSLEVTVEHVGSTAVPGLDGKPVIDILLGVRMADLTDAHLDALRELGYGYARARRGGLCLSRGRPRSHFIHVVEMGGWEWQEKILFRDYLRSNPAVASRYALLKTGLVRGGSDRAAYALGNQGLIEEILAAARRWEVTPAASPVT